MARICSNLRTTSLLISGGKIEFAYSIPENKFYSRDDTKFVEFVRRLLQEYAVLNKRTFEDVIKDTGKDEVVDEIIKTTLSSMTKIEDVSSAKLPQTASYTIGLLDVNIVDGIIVSIVKRCEFPGTMWKIERNNAAFWRKLRKEIASVKKTSPIMFKYISKSAQKDDFFKVMCEEI